MNTRIVKSYLGSGFYITKEPAADGDYSYWLGFQDTDCESPLQGNSYKISIDEATYIALKADRRRQLYREETY